jgi:hypothetical protein
MYEIQELILRLRRATLKINCIGVANRRYRPTDNLIISFACIYQFDLKGGAFV